MSLYDPLLEAETQNHNPQTPIKISRETTLFTTKPESITRKIWKQTKFLLTYCLLTGTIFSVLMGTMNFQAYSHRISHWFNPNAYAQESQEISEIISQSQGEIHTSQSNLSENRNVIAEKVFAKNPEMVYSRSYSESSLLANIPLHSAEKATFEVTPLENRIIIPKIGKNIPLIDVYHDAEAGVTDMHNIFMEELKKGIVRYPGTAEPGQVGNSFIFGHSSNYPWIQSDYNDVFALLDTLETGDEIIVYYNQKKFVYRVTDRSVVKPGDTSVLLARDPNKKEISLMTCWPIGTTLERLLIFGELVEEK